MALVAPFEVRYLRSALFQRAQFGAGSAEVGGTAKGTLLHAIVLPMVKPGMRALEEEVPAPVAEFLAFDDDTHALELATIFDVGHVGRARNGDMAQARASASVSA